MSDTDWKKKCQELENEMILIKGITVTNSPEMREAKKKIAELEESLANALEVNESHQKLNGRLQERLTEVEEDNKKLAQQIDNSLNRMRKAGVI
jgi:chromosome segregation ATPase